MFEFIGFLLAVIALLMVRNAGKRIVLLEQRIAELSAGAAPAPVAKPAPETPPDSSFEIFAPKPVEEPAPTPQAALAAAFEKLDEKAIEQVIADTTAAPPPPPLPPEQPAPPQKSFEERFGANWVVWIGGLALALGGIFMVQYSIEAGLIGPGVRIFFGALLAAALIAAGEWTRRNELASGFGSIEPAHIPSILTAAGTVVAFAVIYAAYALYGFLGPASAFVLLGIVAFATLAASLLHGPWLAALGQLGAFVVPMMIASQAPNFWALYIYLAFVVAASFALARMRLWRWLVLTAVGAATFWMLPGLGNAGAIDPHAFHAVVSFALSALLIVSGLLYGPSHDEGGIEPVSSLALGAFLACAALLVLATDHDGVALTVFVLLTLATLAIAWRTEAAAAAVPVAGVLVALVIADWAVDIQWHSLVAPGGPVGNLAGGPQRASYGGHLALGFGLAGLFAATGYLAQGRSVRSEVPILWATTAVVAPLLILIALYARISGYDRSLPFAAIALLHAALFAVATETLSKRGPLPGIPSAAAIFATGSIAALALALTFALEKGWLTVALALMVPGTAWVAGQRPLPWLRNMCGILVVLVMLRVGYDPRIVADSTTPIFNWILYGYGVPAAAFWLAGWLLRRQADDQAVRTVEAGAILFTVLTGFLEIRHYVYSGDIYSSSFGLNEVALQVCGGLAMAIGLERLRARSHSVVHETGALIVAALSFAAIVFGLMLSENPWLTGANVGGLIFNLILLGYGIPAVLVAVLGLVTRGVRPQWYSTTAAVTAVVLALMYLTFQVTRFFQGPQLDIFAVSDAEGWTYSAVWLAFGVALLVAGIYLRSQPVRLCSAAVVLATVIKVFLLDMAGLTGVWRAFSFIGLGLVLMGIGYLYQRLLFVKKPPEAEAPPAQTEPQPS